MGYGLDSSLINQVTSHRSSLTYSTVVNQSDYVDDGRVGTLYSELHSRNVTLCDRGATRITTTIHEHCIKHELPSIQKSFTLYCQALLGLLLVHNNSADPVDCAHGRVPCIDIHGYSSHGVCIDCGTCSPCNTIIRVNDIAIELHDEQSCSPCLYLDNCLTLPSVLLDEVSYLRQMSDMSPIVVSPGTFLITPDELALDVPIYQSHECVVVGSITNGIETIVVSCVRPTINYCTYKMTCNISVISSTITTILKQASSFRQYTNTEFRVDTVKPHRDEIQISGTMAHYYVMQLGLDAVMTHVSMGGSTLMIHHIDHYETNDPLTVIVPHIGIIHALAPDPSEVWHVEMDITSVLMKYMTNRTTVTGPSLTLGQHGEMQWMGKPDDYSVSMRTALIHMSNKMKSVKFVNSI